MSEFPNFILISNIKSVSPCFEGNCIVFTFFQHEILYFLIRKSYQALRCTKGKLNAILFVNIRFLMSFEEIYISFKFYCRVFSLLLCTLHLLDKRGDILSSLTLSPEKSFCITDILCPGQQIGRQKRKTGKLSKFKLGSIQI